MDPLRFLLALAFATAAFAGCGGDDENDNTTGGQAAPPAGDIAADERAVDQTVRRWVDRDDCTLLSERFRREYFGGKDAQEQCAREFASSGDPGLRAGDYRVKRVSVTGDRGEVQLTLDGGGERTYGLVRDRERWLVDSFSEELSGRVGEGFTYRDAYEIDGRAIDINLHVTLLRFDDPAPPPEFLEEQGKRWVRARIRYRSRGDDRYGQSPDFELIDSRGQRYTPEGVVYEPALAPTGVTNLSPGDTAVGWLAFKVPARAKLRTLRFVSLVNSGVTPLEWELR